MTLLEIGGVGTRMADAIISRTHRVAENTMSLNKTFVLFGLVALAIITAALFATVPPAGPLAARERSAQQPCRTEQVSLDQGYGVTRVAERRICDDY